MTNGMVFDTRGFILKKIQWHIHAGSWSLVNCWWEALTRHYIRCSWILMNAAVGLMDGLGLDGNRCIRVIPRHPPFSMKEEALPACKETIVRNTMVLKGLSNATDLNVLQGKAYEKPCWPQYIRDQYVLKGPRYELEMNLNPLSIYICTHCPQMAQRC